MTIKGVTITRNDRLGNGELNPLPFAVEITQPGRFANFGKYCATLDEAFAFAGTRLAEQDQSSFRAADAATPAAAVGPCG
jgi:hypothetical protein